MYNSKISIKILKGNDLLKLPTKIKNFGDLINAIGGLIKVKSQDIKDEKYKMYYLDRDDDIITISTRECFQHASKEAECFLYG